MAEHWSVPAALPLLAPETAHVWRVPLDGPEESLQRFRALLSVDEAERANRYRFERDRRRYVAARGALRWLLAQYLEEDPATIRFRYGPYGKPYLDHPESSARPGFNVSHAGALALIAVAPTHRVGVDVEQVRVDMDHLAVAEHVFSARERAILRTLPATLQVQAFFHAWTRKEAYIKAVGTGISMGLGTFDVSLRPGEPAALLHTEADPEAPARWHLRHLEPGAGYQGALAIEGRAWNVETWHLDFDG